MLRFLKLPQHRGGVHHRGGSRTGRGGSHHNPDHDLGANDYRSPVPTATLGESRPGLAARADRQVKVTLTVKPVEPIVPGELGIPGKPGVPGEPGTLGEL